MNQYTSEERERILNEQFEIARKKARENLNNLEASFIIKERQGDLDKARDEYLRKKDRVLWQTTQDEQIHCTDFGNAIRFMKHYGQSCLYCSQQDTWYLWNGDGYWKKDSLLFIQHMTREMLQNIYNETQYAGDPDKRTMLAKWAIQCEHPQHIQSCLKELVKMPSVAVPVDKFDNDKFLFNLKNGTYDLQNHIFLQHDRMNFITREVSYDYDPSATCPEFLKFLNRIFRSRPDKGEIIQYLQKGIGYSLTGDTSKQVIFLLHGSGANGKSTLIETIRKLMGEYGTTISANALTTKKNDSVRNDIARLMNVRFVSTSENAIGTSLDEELIKNLTGGDQVAARFLFQEEFLFHPHLKLWWAFNHPPGIRDMTHSLWRRLKMIPFEEKIPDGEQIPQPILLAQFEKELSGIFNWAISGLKQFQNSGLNDVVAVSEAIEHFREDQDVLFDFIKDCCYVPEQQTIEQITISESIKNLFVKYIEWSKQNNIDTKYFMSKKRFSQELADRGFKREHLRTGNIYHGIQIK